MLMQIGEGEFQFLARLQIKQVPALKIAGEYPPGLIRRVDAVKVIERLALGAP
ncbi:hypothetical protein LCM19_01340 [Qipengyuania flava]|nr:hypothetical protein [Qipengyuania flava]